MEWRVWQAAEEPRPHPRVTVLGTVESTAPPVTAPGADSASRAARGHGLSLCGHLGPAWPFWDGEGLSHTPTWRAGSAALGSHLLHPLLLRRFPVPAERGWLWHVRLLSVPWAGPGPARRHRTEDSPPLFPAWPRGQGHAARGIPGDEPVLPQREAPTRLLQHLGRVFTSTTLEQGCILRYLSRI